MIDDLKRVFSRTWDAFVAEVSRRDPEDEVAGLLGAMRREMVDARASLPVLEEGIRAAEAELARERRALEDTERRGALAERAGDAETVSIAAEWAERHRRRVALLEDKVRTARGEHELRAAEVEDMMRRYKEADANRFTLLNEVRRARQHQRLDQAARTGDADWDRAAERLERDIAYSEALDDLAGLDPTPPPPPPREDLVEARLQEMKRRMGL